MNKYQNPFNLPDEHMRMVGIIAALWEQLDLVIMQGVTYVTKNKFSEVLIFTTYMDFSSKLNVIEAYARQYKEVDIEVWREFEKTLKSIRQANNFRNEFVHAKWCMEDGNTDPSRYVLRLHNGKLIQNVETVSSDKLVEVAKHIYDTGEIFTKLMLRVGMPKL